jgi:hypothetical protein
VSNTYLFFLILDLKVIHIKKKIQETSASVWFVCMSVFSLSHGLPTLPMLALNSASSFLCILRALNAGAARQPGLIGLSFITKIKEQKNVHF